MHKLPMDKNKYLLFSLFLSSSFFPSPSIPLPCPFPHVLPLPFPFPASLLLSLPLFLSLGCVPVSVYVYVSKCLCVTVCLCVCVWFGFSFHSQSLWIIHFLPPFFLSVCPDVCLSMCLAIGFHVISAFFYTLVYLTQCQISTFQKKIIFYEKEKLINIKCQFLNQLGMLPLSHPSPHYSSASTSFPMLLSWWMIKSSVWQTWSVYENPRGNFIRYS